MDITHRGSARTFAILSALVGAVLIVLVSFGTKTTTTTTLTPAAPIPASPAPVIPGPATPLAPQPTAPVIPPETPKPADHFALNLGTVFNDMIGSKWKRENHDDNGIPASGRVLVPGVLPRAYFQFATPDEPNAIQLQPGTPVTVSIPQQQRGKYGRLAVLSGSAKNSVAVHATLHYSSGEDVSDELRVQDWNRRDEAKETYVYKALTAGSVQLFSQIVKLDTDRILESVTFQADAKAVIFSMTVIVSSSRPFDGNK
jgi:hypothetical protein